MFKFLRKIYQLFLITLSTFILVLIKIVSIFYKVNFISIRSDVIGHSIIAAEGYLLEKKINRPNELDFCYFSYPIMPNIHWKKMVKRNLFINEIFRYCDHINNKIFKKNNNSYKNEFGFVNNDKYGLIAKNETVIKFNKKEDIIGKSFLLEIGLKKNQKFVCLLARDSSYKKKFQLHIKNDWSYHNYRNVEISTYEMAVKYLLDEGYFVIRMGKTAEKKLNIKNDYFLDYPYSKYRSDFLDLWLMANCTFAISSGSGIDIIAYTHNVPTVYANYDLAQYMPLWSKSITQPKKILNIKNNKFLNLYDHLDFNINHLKKSKKYKISEYKYVDLNAEEIFYLVKEMHQRLNNKYNNKSSVTLQKKFINNLKKYENYNEYYSYIHPDGLIGTNFLEKNKEWYDV